VNGAAGMNEKMSEHLKKIQLTLILLPAVLFLAGCGNINQQIVNEAKNETENLKETRSFAEVTASLDTPQKVYDWMKINIIYRPDETYADEYRDAETTFQLGYGDCDDYAMFADYVLKKHGYKTTIISVYTDSKGHSVCVWEGQNKKLNDLSNTGIQQLNAQDLMEVADNVYTDWKVYSVYPSNEGVLRPADR
jgi:hypothetical protein